MTTLTQIWKSSHGHHTLQEVASQRTHVTRSATTVSNYDTYVLLLYILECQMANVFRVRRPDTFCRLALLNPRSSTKGRNESCGRLLLCLSFFKLNDHTVLNINRRISPALNPWPWNILSKMVDSSIVDLATGLLLEWYFLNALVISCGVLCSIS